MENTVLDIEYDEAAWNNVLSVLEQRFGKKPDVQTLICLVGHRELGKHHVKFTKEQKQQIIVSTNWKKIGMEYMKQPK